MLPFAEVILKVISDYKLLLRKLYPAHEASLKIKDLGLKGSQLRRIDDLHLYKTALVIVKNLEEYVATHDMPKSHRSYFGAEEFLHYLKSFLSVYAIEKNRVIHTEREASLVVMEAIQLVTLPKNKLTKQTFERLFYCADIVSKYGNIEHMALLNDAIKKNERNLMCYLNKYGVTIKIEDLFAKI